MNFVIVLTIALVAIFVYLLGRNRGRSEARPPMMLPGPDAAAEPELPAHLHELYVTAREVDGFYEAASRPEDLLSFTPFRKLVETLEDERFTPRDLFGFVFGDRSCLTCAAIEALGRRADPPVPDLRSRLLEQINRAHAWYRFFALRALAADEDRRYESGDESVNERGLVQDLFEKLDVSWIAPVPTFRALETFLEDRLSGPHRARIEDEIVESLPEETELREMIVTLLRRVGTPELVARLASPGEETVVESAPPAPSGPSAGSNVLAEIGRFVRVPDPPDWVSHAALDELVNSLAELIVDRRAPSMLLVGESGVGRTTTVRALAKKLQSKNWRIFESTASSVVAGQVYIGELEQRIRELMKQLDRRRRVVWHVPNFHEMIWVGRGSEVPRSLLSLVLPYVERGELVILGETNPNGYERLLQHNPQLRFLLHTVRIAPLGDRASQALGEAWGEANRLEASTSLFENVSIREIQNLARQYLSTRAAPGNLVGLLEKAREQAAKRSGKSLTRDDVLRTLAEQTGLPVNLLDERAALDLKKVRDFFEARLMGQPEAVDCLVERLSMIKAGLTDSTRPLGVFLFAGPTGTGKTEMGKVLAEYLFGSPERMIRIDMSELQGYDGLDRIVGDGSRGTESVSLVQRIRSQPFSVILLDEFEKAHARIWDLFLQMFDDGRLTDRHGNTADFRNSVVIMTSNAGFENVHASIGFFGESLASGRRDRELERRLRQTFRPELLNRMDRVVTFRPLDRPTMRSLIRKELNDALQRRGLRSRSWAVEWDSSAVDFLLEQGFTTDLGARPLKRAIERHLLAPLAETIVNREAPGGDQFLFVRSDGTKITVTFVDPDAPEEPADGRGPRVEPRADMSVESIALDPTGRSPEIEFLRDLYEEMDSRIGGPEWVERKEAAFARMAEAGFWELPDRFVTLGEAEYMDRIETGFETAGSLLQRMGSKANDRSQIPKSIIQLLAQQLHLLSVALHDLEAGGPRDAFLRVDCDQGAEHGRVLGTMYRSWARKRRMRVEELEERTAGDGYRLTLAVSGFGAHSLLALESGLHVFELPSGQGREFDRHRVRVTVVPQPEAPSPDEDPVELATHELESTNPAATIVRVYRFGSAPLVRDRMRHWRTGRVERVLEGDFDLLGTAD